jgi:hypothetical protein
LLVDLLHLEARGVSIHSHTRRSGSIRQFAIRVQSGSQALSHHSIIDFNSENAPHLLAFILQKLTEQITGGITTAFLGTGRAIHGFVVDLIS